MVDKLLTTVGGSKRLNNKDRMARKYLHFWGNFFMKPEPVTSFCWQNIQKITTGFFCGRFELISLFIINIKYYYITENERK